MAGCGGSIIEEREIVSQLLLSLLGEQSNYFKLNCNDIEFSFRREKYNYLPAGLNYKVDKIARLMTNVRIIEQWLQKNVYVDSIKRAFVESISKTYRTEFANIVIDMRTKHIEGECIYSIQEILNFINKWQDRIGYITALIYEVTRHTFPSEDWRQRVRGSQSDEMCGMEAMNLAFDEFTLQCIADWTYTLLEDILKACSRALHQVISSWILEGELRPGVMWMVSLDEDDHNDTFESTNKGQLDNSSLISLKIKDDLIPRALRNSYDLVEKVLEIGRKMKFLKGLKQSAFKTNEELNKAHKIFDAELKPDIVWYNIRYKGHLSIVLPKIDKIISTETMNELMVQQRIMDHLMLLHSYFFMLRSDLVTGLEDQIAEKLHSNLETGKLPTKAEEYLSTTINTLVPRNNYADLVNAGYIKAERRSSKSKNIDDFFQIRYKPPEPVKTILGRTVRIYRRIFTFICPTLLLFYRLDSLSLAMRHKTTYLVRDDRDLHPHMLRIQLKIFTMRSFLVKLLGYIFKVLQGESEKMFTCLKGKADLHNFITGHEHFLRNYIAAALFQRDSAAAQRDLLAVCTERIRTALKYINTFVASAAKAANTNDRIELVSENGLLEQTNFNLDELELEAKLAEFEDLIPTNPN